MDIDKIFGAAQTLSWIWLGLGAAGSVLEKIGMETGSSKLIAVGKTLESLSIDLPKLIGLFRR